MAKKLKVAVIYGGKSAERDISKISAAFIIKSLEAKKYSVTKIEIDAKGKWPASSLNSLFSKKFDAAVPMIHGPMGEDGTLQGLLELSGTPYVGCGVLASAACMDKEIAYRLAREADLPFLPYKAVSRFDWKKNSDQIIEEITSSMGFPVFVKPLRMGSSVGVSKVKKEEELRKACETALKYDTKVMIQEGITAREIECAVLGDEEETFASIPGEIIPSHEFYSYEAKYLDPNGAALKIPAALTPEQIEEVKALARRSFLALNCEGMGRVDFLMDKSSGVFYFNEINTIPGFTQISMYPKMMEASSLPAPKLLDKLIALALKRAKTRAKISLEHPKK